MLIMRLKFANSSPSSRAFLTGIGRSSLTVIGRSSQTMLAESIRLSRVLLIRFLILFSFCCFSQISLSQTVNSASEDEVAELLAEIESKNRTRSIFSLDSRRKIGEIEYDSRFNVVKNMGKWSIVEFNQQTVPGWVSSDYVTIRGGRATVSVDRLNIRMRPSLSSNVMTQVNRGYQSRVYGRKSGFVRVLAPKNTRVALFSGTDSEASSSLSSLSNGTQSTGSRSVPQAAETNEALALGEPKRATLPSERAAEQGRLDDVGASSSERLHIIAPGDAVSLLVFGESDLSIENVRVPQSGRVSFPLIGSVLVAGQTIPQVENSVAVLLAQGYVKNPRLSVTMFSYRPVFIRGAIQQTGSFPFSEGLTVGKAIALAGGSKNSAKRNGVSILRAGEVIESALTVDSQIEVQSGDVITIEEEVGVQEGDASYIYLHGEVAAPGEYQFRRGLTVEKAIVLAGGFTLRGSRKKISVTRYADIEEDQEPEKLKRVKLFTPIKPGDIINVGATWF